MDDPDDIRIQALCYAALAILSLAVAGALWTWRRPRMLPLPQLRGGLWSGREVLFAYVLMTLLPSLMLLSLLHLRGTGAPLTNDDYLRQLLWVLPAALPAILAFDFAWMHWLASTRPAEIGFSFVRMAPNAIWGMLGFVLMTPIVLGVHLLLLRFWSAQAHPIEKLAMDRSLSPVEWGLLWFQATIYAPIIEEWFFRGVLQGWLRSASPLGHAMLLLSTFATGAMPLSQHYSREPKPAVRAEAGEEKGGAPDLDAALWGFTFAALLGTAYGFAAVRRWQPVIREGTNWFLPPSEKEPETGIRSAEAVTGIQPAGPIETNDVEEEESSVEEFDEAEINRMREIMRQPKWLAWQRSLADMAIFGSAMFWAVSHATWPAPVPLFLMGLVLGWLRMKTQNLWPCIVLHSLFNHVAFGSLVWVAMQKG